METKQQLKKIKIKTKTYSGWVEGGKAYCVKGYMGGLPSIYKFIVDTVTEDTIGGFIPDCVNCTGFDRNKQTGEWFGPYELLGEYDKIMDSEQKRKEARHANAWHHRVEKWGLCKDCFPKALTAQEKFQCYPYGVDDLKELNNP